MQGKAAQRDTRSTDLVIAGIDGGGSSTRAVVVSLSGRFAGIGQAGPSNPNYTPEEKVRHNVQQALQSAWRSAGVEPSKLSAAFFGIAGASSYGTERLRRLLLGSVALVTNGQLAIDSDLRIALAGGLHQDQGIVLIAGTGSACYGRDVEGAEARAGGWGASIDDAGSGYWLAIEGLRAAVRAADGRGPRTGLIAEAKNFFSTPDLRRLPALLQDPELTRDKVAAFSRLVSKLAKNGDTVSQDILFRGAAELTTMAFAVCEQLSGTVCNPVVFTGGMTSDTRYVELVADALRRRGLTLVPRKSPPIIGAAWLAAKLCGESLDAHTMERLGSLT
jgi:N-acetylglucosamine kinase-like BadF-type ATPase